MFVGNFYTYYSSGLAGAVNGLAKLPESKSDATVWWPSVRLTSVGSPSGNWCVLPEWLYLCRPHRRRQKIKKFDFRKEKVFDAVILQDNSTGPIHPQRKEIFLRSMQNSMHTICSVLASNLLIMMTWARKNKPEMTQQLADATTKVGNEADAMVIPVGLALPKRSSKIQLELYRADKHTLRLKALNLGGLRCLLRACTIVRLSDWNTTELSKLKKRRAHFLQEVAWNTVCEYFGWKK